MALGCVFLNIIHFELNQLLTGLSIPQEYVCLPLEDLSQPLSVYLTIKNNSLIYEVTADHVFLGYKPLLLSISLKDPAIENADTVCLNFVAGVFKPTTEWKGFLSTDGFVARLVLRKIKQTSLIGKSFLFEGVYGEHRMLNSFYKLINGLRERLRKRKIGNVGLPGNLYDQVRIAYAVPRVISLITLGNENRMNMFPTDLHGSVDEKYYVGSLRIGGKANDQVEQEGKLVISFMPVKQYQFVYSLGKNHMQDMAPAKNFVLSEGGSNSFGIPVPAGALKYIELKRIRSVDAGIHRIHLYEKVNEENLCDGKTLAHVHQFYAQWRLNHNLQTPMLLR
jgi:flavin reductase (DIM6/NTAB) family NADH-FMN oxidoreductase RutF